MQITNLLQMSTMSIQNDISSCSRLITISRKNNCYLVRCVCGQIISAVVCFMIKAKGNFALLVWSHVLSELKSLLIHLDSWMTMVKHVLKGLHGCPIKGCIHSIVHTKIQCLLWVIDVELGIDGR